MPDFLPNNDVAPARKKRIEKAREYGAQWARHWTDDVTHVIVDGGLLLSDVRKSIGHDRLKVSFAFGSTSSEVWLTLTDFLA